MDWQLPVVFAALTVALSYVSRSAWQTWFGAAGKSGCASDCGGCAKSATSDPGEGTRISLPRV